MFRSVVKCVFLLFLLLGQTSFSTGNDLDRVCAEYFQIIAPHELRPAKKPLPSKIQSLADHHTLDFHGPEKVQTFESGDPVSLSWVPSGEVMAQAKAGIFVGAVERDGDVAVVLDEGLGITHTVPVKKLRTMNPSTTNARPSRGDGWEKLGAKLRELRNWHADHVTPVFNRAVYIGLPELVGTAFTLQAAQWVVSGLVDSFHHSDVGALAVGGLVTALASTKGKIFLQGTLKLLHGLAASGANVILQPKVHMSKASFANSVLDLHLMAKESSVADVDGVRKLLLPSRKQPAADFAERAEAAVAAIRGVKKYMHEIGVPALEEAMPVIVSEDRFGSLAGSMGHKGLGLVYLGPEHLTKRYRADLRKLLRANGEELRFASEQNLKALGLDPTVAAHEAVHNLLAHYLYSNGAEQLREVVDEFGADYFSSSGLGRTEPVVGYGSFFQSSALREGVIRAYPEPYPPALNVNSIAQFSGDYHVDSQLLFRMVWRLREAVGRESLDPLVLKALLHISSLQRSTREMLPVKNLIDMQRRDTYVFAASLKDILDRAGKVDEARKWVEILEAADMPEDVVERVQSLFRG